MWVGNEYLREVAGDKKLYNMKDLKRRTQTLKNKKVTYAKTECSKISI